MSLTTNAAINELVIAIGDERLEQSLSKERNFKLTQVFLPKVMKSVYDVDNDRLVELWDKSIEVSNNTYINHNKMIV